MTRKVLTSGGLAHVARVPCAEPLESRLLWSVSNFAPSTIAGLVIELNADVGKSQFRASADAATYQMTGVFSGAGTYSYGRNSPTVATLRVVETGDNLTSTATLTFNSSTAGNFSVVSADRSVQNGTFKLVGTVEPLVTLTGGVLTVNATFSDDGVAIVNGSGKLYVTENNWTSTFTASSVKSINVDLGDGKDSLAVGSGVIGLYCYAGSGNDSIVGGDGNDTLTGGAGKDRMDGGKGDDRVAGSASHDSLVGGEGNDRIYGDDGYDTLTGSAGVDRLFGGTGNDVLVGNSGNDKLYGESGDDALYGKAGVDIVNGGDGNDVCDHDPLDIEFEMED